jgi:hypothetical protein
MINRLQLAILLLATALGTATLPAQSAPQEKVAPPTSTAPEKSAPQQASAHPAPAAPEQAEKNTPPDKKDKDSPFDYHSSEEISEDLPVSFPVDI